MATHSREFQEALYQIERQRAMAVADLQDEKLGGRRMREPVLSENTRIAISVTAAIAVLAFVLGVGVKYGEWSKERAQMIEHSVTQDFRLDQLEKWRQESILWQARAESKLDQSNDKLDSLLRINNVLLYSAGGDRKKPPANN